MAHRGMHHGNNTNFKAAVIRKINTKMRLCQNIIWKAVDLLNSSLSSPSSSELQPLTTTIIIIRVSILCFYRPLAGCQTGWIQCRFHNGASGICGRCGVSVNSSSALQADGVGYLRWNESAWTKQSKPEGCCWLAAVEAGLRPFSAPSTCELLHRLALITLTGARRAAF